MDRYDDRPISVYDNLNMSSSMHTSTPKQQKPSSMAQTSNGNTTQSPYTEISFKFDETNNKRQNNNHQEVQNISNGNQLPLQNSNQRPGAEQTLSQVNMNTPYYATPIKPTTASNPLTTTLTHNDKPTTTVLDRAASASSHINKTPLAPFQQQQHAAQVTNPPLTPLAATIPTTFNAKTAAIDATTPENSYPITRPLSQHSQSDLNESIAAVKAALNDAKSKFFGLNGYSPNSTENFNNKTSPTNNPSTGVSIRTPKPFVITPTQGTNESPLFTNLLPQSESDQNPAKSNPQSYPQAQYQGQPQPPPKQQPKYQNIPENSAIFRNQQKPPELPPKPLHLSPPKYSSNSPSHSASPNSIGSVSPSPERGTNTPTTSQNNSNMPLATSSFMTPSNGTDPNGASSTAKLLPHATYKQLPLNDIDNSHPSQAVYMTTTVPQNIKGSKIAGRHTPTRNSLRHSRMLVVNNKNYQGPDYPNPLNLKRQILAIWLLILQILIGTFILCLALWIMLLAPNTPIQDNPYWSGLILILAGILGLSIIRFQRIKRRKLREHCFGFLKVNSYVISLLAVLLCCIATLCAIIHLVRLTASDTKCAPTNVLLEHGSCTCSFRSVNLSMDAEDHSNKDDSSNKEDSSYKYEYRDLSCEEVSGKWQTILGLSIGLNALGMMLALMYISMLVCCRYSAKRYYSSVQTSTF